VILVIGRNLDDIYNIRNRCFLDDIYHFIIYTEPVSHGFRLLAFAQ